MDKHGNLVLEDGARIAVVGAGPAGCFFAHFATQAAARRGISLNIVLYDGKSFARGGPAGCNMCAGVVAPTLVRRLEAMGMDLPVVVEVPVDYAENMRLTEKLGHLTCPV